MKNYDEMSDFEVNKQLSILLGEYKPLDVKNLIVDVVGDVEHHRQYGGPMHATHLDYCDSWSDMGPLIEQHKIHIEFQNPTSKWNAYAMKQVSDDVYDLDCVGNGYHENPLRAAALCLIEKLEAEQ